MRYASKQHTTSQSAAFVQPSSQKEERCVTLVDAVSLIAFHLSNSEFTLRVIETAMQVDLEKVSEFTYWDCDACQSQTDRDVITDRP